MKLFNYRCQRPFYGIYFCSKFSKVILHFETASSQLFSCCMQDFKVQKCPLPNSCAVRDLSDRSSLSQVIISYHFCHFNPTLLNPFLRPHLPGLPPSPARLSTFCPCVNISHCCCRWCVMRGTEHSLCVRSVGAEVCGSPACGVSWQACGRWRQPAACLSVCLSVQLHLTATDIAVPAHTHRNMHTHTLTLLC